MNLRQKYKRAKQRLEMLEQIPTKPVIYDSSRGEVVTLRSEKRIAAKFNESDMLQELFEESVMKELGQEACREFATVHSEVDPYTGDVIVRAEIKVVR